MFQLFYQSWKEGGQSLSRKVGMIWTVHDIWISKQDTSQAIKLAGMNSVIINNYAKSTQSLVWRISNHVFYFVFFLFCYVWRRVELIPRYNNPSSLVKSTDVYEVASEEAPQGGSSITQSRRFFFIFTHSRNQWKIQIFTQKSQNWKKDRLFTKSRALLNDFTKSRTFFDAFTHHACK